MQIFHHEDGFFLPYSAPNTDEKASYPFGRRSFFLALQWASATACLFSRNRSDSPLSRCFGWQDHHGLKHVANGVLECNLFFPHRKFFALKIEALPGFRYQSNRPTKTFWSAP